MRSVPDEGAFGDWIPCLTRNPVMKISNEAAEMVIDKVNREAHDGEV